MQPKKIMKHFLIILAILVMGVTLTGCHSDNDTTPPATPDYVQIIVDKVGTYTYNYGPKSTTYTGTACGGLNYNYTHIMSSSQTFTSKFDTAVTNGCLIGFEGSNKDATTGNIRWISSSVGYNVTNTKLTITNYGEVGGKIEGSFTGTIMMGTESMAVSGSFRVTRFGNQTIDAFLEIS